MALSLKKSADALTQAEIVASAELREAHSLTLDVHYKLVEPGGLLDISKATMLHIDRASGEAAIASRQQRVYWDQLGARSVTTLAAAQHSIETLDRTIASIGQDVHGTTQAVDGVLVKTGESVDSVNADVRALNVIIADPDITASIKSLAESSKHVELTTESVSHIAATIDGQVKKLANPTKGEKALGWLMTVLRGASYTSWLFK